MRASVKAMERRQELVLTQQQQEIRVSCHACGSETPVHITFQKPLSDIPMENDPRQMGIEGFPVARYPVLGRKAPREVPIGCMCGAFALRRRKSEPRAEEGAELRLYRCGGCGKNVLTREEFWRYSEKSYIESSARDEE